MAKTMDLNEPILVHWLDFDLLSRLGMAAVIGLLLCLDRELRAHTAGMRMHGLICFSAAASRRALRSIFHSRARRMAL